MQTTFIKQGVKQSIVFSRYKEQVVNALRHLANQLDDSNGRIINVSLNHSEGFGTELTIETHVMENEPRTKSNP